MKAINNYLDFIFLTLSNFLFKMQFFFLVALFKPLTFRCMVILAIVYSGYIHTACRVGKVGMFLIQEKCSDKLTGFSFGYLLLKVLLT